MTNGLSVRQEQGCGWLFYHAKKNRLCLSFYSIQRDCVILEVLALFVCFAFHASVVRHQKLSKNVFLFCMFSSWEWGDLMKCINTFRSGWTNLRLFIMSPKCAALSSVNSCVLTLFRILLRLLHCGKYNVLWPVLGARDLILLFPCLLLLIASTSEPENGCAAVITEAQHVTMGVRVSAIIYSIWARTQY